MESLPSYSPNEEIGGASSSISVREAILAPAPASRSRPYCVVFGDLEGVLEPEHDQSQLSVGLCLANMYPSRPPNKLCPPKRVAGEPEIEVLLTGESQDLESSLF